MKKVEKKTPGHEARVLVASSDDGFFANLSRALEFSGAKTTRWSSGSARVPPGGYHLMVLDADNSERQIEETVVSARKASPGLMIYAVATDPSKNALLRLLRLGVHRFEHKPRDLERFASAVRLACERSIITRLSAEVFDRLKSSETRLDRNQLDLQEEIIRSNEDLQTLNVQLHKVVAQLKTLYHMGRDLAENENWSDALDRFLMALVNFMGANGAALLLFSRNESVLAPRSSFQIEQDVLAGTCARILSKWKEHTRSGEIHSLESYGGGRYTSCLEDATPWRSTVIPLRHRNQPLGFLVLDKEYKNGIDFKSDFDFLNTLQTIFVEEIANASYISELRQLSRFNNKVLDNIRSGVITTDLKGTVNYSNEWAQGMCPRLRGTKLVLHFDELFKSRQFSPDFFERVLKSRKTSHVLEVECRASEADSFPARLRTAKMYDDNLGGMVIVAIFEDLTEQKRMEAEIRRNDRLRILGQLSAGVAHEIRNPLTGIATSVEILGGKLGDDEAKLKYIRAVMDEINRLDNIIRNLLDFARPPKPKIAPCSLPDVITRVFSLVSEETERKQVHLRPLEKPGAVYCEADPAQLTQVLLNIVLNAVQACGEGDEVRVDIEQAPPTDPAYAKVVRIDVTDNGPGVPSEVREVLFDPFVTTKASGTGLGLAISQHIIEDHHGSIKCEFLERGTRFSIFLPQHEPSELGNQTI